MAPVYADHPFTLLPDPRKVLKDGEKYDFIDELKGEMTCVHNYFIRSLNAIYLQAPYVTTPADRRGLADFTLIWYTALHAHHNLEERSLFRFLESRVGTAKLMEGNVDQHHGFVGGLNVLGMYVRECSEGRSELDGAQVVSMIDQFGPALHRHLTEEIGSFEGLRQYGSETFAGMEPFLAEEGKRAMKEIGLFTGLPFATMSVDDEYEGGRWHFPPIPHFAIYIIRTLAVLFQGYLRFAPVNRFGVLQPLYAVPKDKVTK